MKIYTEEELLTKDIRESLKLVSISVRNNKIRNLTNNIYYVKNPMTLEIVEVRFCNITHKELFNSVIEFIIFHNRSKEFRIRFQHLFSDQKPLFLFLFDALYYRAYSYLDYTPIYDDTNLNYLILQDIKKWVINGCKPLYVLTRLISSTFVDERYINNDEHIFKLFCHIKYICNKDKEMREYILSFLPLEFKWQ
jgi:hypothetical protein